MLPPHLIACALESAPDAIVISDASGRIVFASRQVYALFGYESEELMERPIEVLLPERMRSSHLHRRADFIAAPRVRPMGVGLDLHARRKDGSEFPVEISLSPIHDGAQVLVAAAIRDVTDRMRIQHEMAVARQVAIEARDVADRANQAKSRFLATASHDLRQPLQSLALLNGTLRRLVNAPEAREALGQQEQAIGAMARLLNALLDISKLESGAIKPEVTDFTVAAIFDELRTEFASLAVNKGLRLRVESCDDTVRSDPSLLEQVLRNLVSNAIKYTRQGQVLLRCVRAPALVRLEVTDTGIGIPTDQLPYIFDEFFQIGTGPGRKSEGYGLGLAIVRRIVKLLGLRIEVQSEPGKGSTFCLEVPTGAAQVAAAAQELPEQAGNDPLPRARPARILLVEDDANVRAATRMLLKTAGYEVAVAASHAEALRWLDALGEFDLLITDFHLDAHGTGLDVIASVREQLGQAFPAILLSGDTSMGVQGREHDRRCRIASKPLQAEQLIALIGELLGLLS
jgi:two-component system, sensor histidine kinase